MQQKEKVSQIAEQALIYYRTGSGLKLDLYQKGASFLSKEQLESGRVFILVGGDGVKRTQLQTNGSFDGKNGMFNPSNSVTHQRFISGGTVNGIPNQRAKK